MCVLGDSGKQEGLTPLGLERFLSVGILQFFLSLRVFSLCSPQPKTCTQGELETEEAGRAVVIGPFYVALRYTGHLSML